MFIRLGRGGNPCERIGSCASYCCWVFSFLVAFIFIYQTNGACLGIISLHICTLCCFFTLSLTDIYSLYLQLSSLLFSLL